MLCVDVAMAIFVFVDLFMSKSESCANATDRLSVEMRRVEKLGPGMHGAQTGEVKCGLAKLEVVCKCEVSRWVDV